MLLDPDTGPLYRYNTNVTLTAQPDDGFTFARWLGDLAGTQSPLTLVIRQDVTGALLSPVGVVGLCRDTSRRIGQHGFCQWAGGERQILQSFGRRRSISRATSYIAGRGQCIASAR